MPEKVPTCVKRQPAYATPVGGARVPWEEMASSRAVVVSLVSVADDLLAVERK